MSVRVLVAAAALLALASGAQAQTNQSATTSSGAQQSTQSVPQEIKQKLSSDGFTNVEIVPGSYLVSAKDKNGDPVMMVIGPHSMTILTELPSSKSSTTGSNSGSSSSQSSSSGTSNSAK
jgi:hypothetical protein